MAQNQTGIIGAGFDNIFYGLRNSQGYLIGNTLAEPSAGDADGSGMMRLAGAVSAPVELTEPDRLSIIGDDVKKATFTFESAEFPSGIIETVVAQEYFDSVINGTLVETLGGNRKRGVLIPNKTAFPSLFIVFQRRALTSNANSVGEQRWEVVVVNNAIVTPLFTTFQTRANNPYRYSLSLSTSNTDPTGMTYTQGTHGTTSSAMDRFISQNPVHYKRWTGNGVLTTFNLDYTPISTAKTLVFVNGVQVTVSSINASAKTFTLSSAPSSGATVVASYEFDEKDLS